VSTSRRAFLRGTTALSGLLVLPGCESAVEQERRADRGAGRDGGRLVIGTLTDVDPKTLYTQSITTMTIGLLVYDTLIRYDRHTRIPAPSVATSWATSPDGLRVTLSLRTDVRFHSGRPLTAVDVAYAIRTYASVEAGSQLQATAQVITAIDTVDPHVVVLHLAHPVPNLFDLFEFMLLVDSETAADLRAGAALIGTGPFVVADRRIGAQTVLRRNERHWRGPAKVDGITLRVIRDMDALLTSLRAHQSDLVIDVSPQSLRPFGAGDLYRVESEDVYDVAYYVGVNTNDSALADRRVRQAISFAVDRDRLLAEVFVGRGFASSAPWAMSSPAYSDAAAQHYRRHLEAAKTLLAAAGPPRGPLLLSYPTGLAVAPNIAAIVANNLAEVGIAVTLDPREQATFSPFIRSGEAQLWINPHGFGQSDPVTLATGAAPFTPAGNLSGFASPEYTRAVERLLELHGPDDPVAQQVYRRFTDILLDEQFVIDLVITTATNVSPAYVKGLAWNRYKYIDAHELTVR